MSRDLKGSLLVIASAVLFGLDPLMAMHAYDNGFDSFSAALARFLFGGLMLLAVCKLILRVKITLPRPAMLRVLALSAFYAVMLVSLYSSYSYMDSGAATTLHFTYPIFVLLLSIPILRTKLTLLSAVCTAICAAGMFLLNTPGSGTSAAGVCLAVASGLAYALYIVFFSKFGMEKFTPYIVSMWLSLFAAGLIAVFGAVSGKLRIPTQPKGYLFMIGVALMCNVFALVFFQKGISMCGGVKASLLSTFEPLTSVVVGLTVYREKFSPAIGLGMAAILVSGALLVFARPKAKKNDEKE